MLAPKARGPLSERVLDAIKTPGSTFPAVDASLADSHDDAQVTLWTAYELHHGGFEDVEDTWEWNPGLLALRAELEADLEARLRERCPWTEVEGDFSEAFFALVASHDGASMSDHVRRRATREQVLELVRHRSVYHLKEADPTTWAVPRLPVVPKAALLEIQLDEYGNGDPNALHSHLWEEGMRACGLTPEDGPYVDDAPVEVLEQNNAMALFGLHRRLRGAAVGHLAAFEATSSIPSRKMAQGLERLGMPDELVHYYREHVEADAVHEQLAVRAVCAPLVAGEPDLLPDVLLGAFSCLDLEDRFASRMLAEWGVA